MSNTTLPLAPVTPSTFLSSLASLASLTPTPTPQPLWAMNFPCQVAIFVIYSLGILGNWASLIILCRVRSRPQNAKHRLMLRCLVSNDLVALIGMMALMVIQLKMRNSKWLCKFRVIWRGFGLYSGCVVVVMAVERYLALTKPFFYQKHVTIRLIKRSIFGLWLICLTVVCMPLAGFGLYYDEDHKKCTRYKLATTDKDIVYAYVYFTYGISLVFCIVWCNLAVMKSLCLKGPPGSHQQMLVRRISRNSSVSDTSNSSTKEEVAFGKLMVLLCVVFVMCWLPQMISIILARIKPNHHLSMKFFFIADMLMAFHFTLNPCLYVLQRWTVFRSLYRSLNHSFSSTKSSYIEADHR